MKTFILLSLFVSFQTIADDWFCTEESGKRDANVIWSCGVGESTTEDYARKRALLNAIDEFDTICEISSDCRGHKRIIEPKRMTCKASGNLIKCYRLIQATIDN